MIISPQSTVTLYKEVPIRNGINIVFTNKHEQTSYFERHVLQSNAPCTVIRKTNVLKIEIPSVLNLRNMNYLSFRNPTFDDRTFYATIINYDYVNNNCVEVIYAIDYWQSYMFDINVHDCLINREHLSEDDYQKSLTNPYDPSILEFQTGETLPVGSMLENNIINSDNMKRIFSEVYSTISSETSSTHSQDMYTIMYISRFDVASLGEKAGLEWIGIQQGVKEKGGFSLQPGAPTLDIAVNADAMWVYDNDSARIITRQLNATWIFCVADFYSSNADDVTVSYIIDKLTEWGVISSLVNMYSVPKTVIKTAFNKYIPYDGRYGRIHDYQQTPLKSTYDSQKLSCYPFSYMRLLSTAGDAEELHYEYFDDLTKGGESFTLGVASTLNDMPCAVVAPKHYKYPFSTDVLSLNATNMMCAMKLTQFPTAAYTTDAYLAAFAAAAQQNIRGNTWIASEERGLAITTAGINNIRTAISDITGAGKISGSVSETEYAGGTSSMNASGDIANPLSAGLRVGVGMFSAGVNAGLRNNQLNLLKSHDQYIDASYDALTGGESAKVFEANFAPTKPAYASNYYTASDGNGAINYLPGGFFDILIQFVSLRDEIQKSYDSYFRNYGYASGRCGQPRIFNYIKGSGDMPHFTYTDEDTEGIKSTYIQTTHLHTTSSISDVDHFVSALFNAGVRMIQGSDLIAKENS